NPITLATPRESITPLDWADKQSINATFGISGRPAPGIEWIGDGGIRRKFQQAQIYNYLDPVPFLYNLQAATPTNYVDTVMTTTSLTPRVDAAHRLFGVPNRLLAGIDIYDTQYNSERPTAPGLTPVHDYDIRQTTAAVYAMNTITVRPDTDISIGGRLQRNLNEARAGSSVADAPDAGFDANHPENAPPDQSERQSA